MDMQGMNMQGTGTQGMPVGQMHNTFWRENQVVVTFHSAIPLVSIAGINQSVPILMDLGLESQRQQLNTYLSDQGLNYTLNFYESAEQSPPQDPFSLEVPRSPDVDTERKGGRGEDSFNLQPGVYLFGLSEPIQSKFGEVATCIVAFFNFTPGPENMQSAMQPAMADKMSEMEDSSRDDDDDNDDDDKSGPPEHSPVVLIVNTFNRGLETLNTPTKDRPVPVPISAAAPNWLWSGTDYVPQGCPLDPPMPVPAEEACSFWHFHLPQLSPKQLRSMTGEGVTVFVLDTLPQLEQIQRAAAKAGDDNLLLFDVGRNVTFNYDVWNAWVAHGNNVNIPRFSVGKDVYGRHFAFKMPDHGLFISGIVHDIAPHARVECIRVLGEYCVGDSDLFLNALSYIQQRISPGGDLYQRPVVINMSMVIPTKAEAVAAGLDPSVGVTDFVLDHIRWAVQGLVQSGAIIVASAGNEADPRENKGKRPVALHPAAFANAPDSFAGVIPVGAVDKDGNVTSYSCYPGENGIATYGGKIPTVNPPNPPSNHPAVTINDAIRGIYSAALYPPLSKDRPRKRYPAPNDNGWTYWVGTSFATPIISAVAARVLEMHAKVGFAGKKVPDVIRAAGGTTTTEWKNLDAATTNIASGSTKGPMLLAVQVCQVENDDDQQEEIDV